MTAVPQTEREFQAQVVELARTLGFRCVHHMAGKTKAGRWTTPTTEIGWPDLTLIRPPRIIFVELKGPTTPIRPGQLQFLELLRQCDLESYLWRSGETNLQEIAEVLATKTHTSALGAVTWPGLS